MWVWFKNWMALTLLTSLALGSVWVATWLQDPSLFPIKTVKVEGVVYHVNQAMLSTALIGNVSKNFFRIDVHAVKQRVLQVPWVADVTVQRVWPYALKLVLTEQVPVAIWNWTELVNARGERFQEDSLFEFADLPVLKGDYGDEQMLLNKLFALQKRFNINALKIREINRISHSIWRLKLQNGIKVTISDVTQNHVVDQFVRAFGSQHLVNQEKISLVDLRYENGFSVRWVSGA